jgi:hypothetical protein
MKMSSGCHKNVNHREPVITGNMLAIVTLTVLAVAGCGPVLDPEEPIFRFEIDLPINEKTTAAELTIEPGMQVVVPLTIVSTRDEPVEVSLSIDREKEFPEAINIMIPEGYISVPTGENVTAEIVYIANETVAPGLYHTSVTGSLRDPIEGQAGIAKAIDIIITDNPHPSIPPKYPPAYFIEAQFPPDEYSRESGLFSLTMERGSSVTLPVNVTSWSDVPIHIRLALSSHPSIPEFVTFEVQQDYVTLEPEESIELLVTFTIAESAIPGSYRMSIWGELEEHVEERATMGQGFTLVLKQ